MSSTDYGSTVCDIILELGHEGATPCLTTGRLAEADPSQKILVRFQKIVSSTSIFLIPDRSDRRSWST